MAPALAPPPPHLQECIDAVGFADEAGYTCSSWANYDCLQAFDYGYTQAGADAILAKCSETCGLCSQAGCRMFKGCS